MEVKQKHDKSAKADLEDAKDDFSKMTKEEKAKAKAKAEK